MAWEDKYDERSGMDDSCILGAYMDSCCIKTEQFKYILHIHYFGS
jgi:hypothetical protein